MNKRNITLLIIVLLIWNVVLTVLLINNKESKQTITEENVYGISTDLTKVAKEGYSSVVSIKSSRGRQSGFIYKQENNKAYVVTTYHGIENDQGVSLTFANGKTVAGSVIGYDNKIDVAVVSIDSPYVLNVVKCGDNEFTKNGEFVICIGASSNKDAANDVELGIVSNNIIMLEDTITIKKENYHIQKEMIGLSLNASEGYSGSPIFNMKNEVIGMIQMSDDEKTYSLTINEIKIIVDKIIAGESVNKINIGIKGKYISNLEDYERNMLNISFDVTGGYYVSDIAKNSIASKLNVQQSDIIISINGNSINTQKDLLNILYSNNIEEMELSVYRVDKIIELKGNIND